jgi:hypothetical protein
MMLGEMLEEMSVMELLGKIEQNLMAKLSIQEAVPT